MDSQNKPGTQTVVAVAEASTAPGVQARSGSRARTWQPVCFVAAGGLYAELIRNQPVENVRQHHPDLHALHHTHEMRPGIALADRNDRLVLR